ncbi:hypothetical protein L596_009537 [Steinernema carpocapsae]|uniref:Uncharacterized protein n=1 Tax=Steinernema carpocapsae TaxID=34508 RepID=A0A4U5PFM7_STECR|nr:hypothetical protein L596_009537 [Steinernema carpocapsae]
MPGRRQAICTTRKARVKRKVMDSTSTTTASLSTTGRANWISRASFGCSKFSSFRNVFAAQETESLITCLEAPACQEVTSKEDPTFGTKP